MRKLGSVHLWSTELVTVSSDWRVQLIRTRGHWRAQDCACWCASAALVGG